MYYDPGWGSLQTALLLWPKRLPQDCHPKVNRHQNILRYLTTMLLQHPLRHAPVGDDEREHPQDCRGKSKSGQEKCRILSSVGQTNCKSTLIVVLNKLACPALKKWIKVSKTEKKCLLKIALWISVDMGDERTEGSKREEVDPLWERAETPCGKWLSHSGVQEYFQNWLSHAVVQEYF